MISKKKRTVFEKSCVNAFIGLVFLSGWLIFCNNIIVETGEVATNSSVILEILGSLLGALLLIALLLIVLFPRSIK